MASVAGIEGASRDGGTFFRPAVGCVCRYTTGTVRALAGVGYRHILGPPVEKVRSVAERCLGKVRSNPVETALIVLGTVSLMRIFSFVAWVIPFVPFIVVVAKCWSSEGETGGGPSSGELVTRSAACRRDLNGYVEGAREILREGRDLAEEGRRLVERARSGNEAVTEAIARTRRVACELEEMEGQVAGLRRESRMAVQGAEQALGREIEKAVTTSPEFGNTSEAIRELGVVCGDERAKMRQAIARSEQALARDDEAWMAARRRWGGGLPGSSG
ncbi:MAG: hypothetical protein OXF02_04020 [Simkaniaceae bacterium]|nr:hypothetical protein [Simkaniaceae bacterium]